MKWDLLKFLLSQNIRKTSRVLLFVMALLCVAALFSLSHLQTQYSVMQFLPEHHAAVEMDQEVRSHFHLTDLPLFVGMLTLGPGETGSWLDLERIQKLAQSGQELKNLESVEQAVSIANVEAATEIKGVVSVGPLVQMTAAENLQKRILEDPLLSPSLISKDEKTALIYLQLKSADAQVLAHFQPKVSEILQKNFPQSLVTIGGVPAIQTDLGLLLNRELRNFLLLTVLACALTLALIFQTWSTVIIPLTLTVFSNLMVFAMMALTGIPFTILSATIPVLVFITVVSLSVHFLLRLDEEGTHQNLHSGHRNQTGQLTLLWQVHKSIWLPNLLGCLTSCVGFLTLLLGDVPLIRNYGVAVAAAVMISWLCTSFGILPLVILLPTPIPRRWVQKPARWALWILQHAKIVFASILILSVGMAITSTHLFWTARLFDDLPAGEPSRKTTEKIDNSMGGIIPLEVVIRDQKESPWNDPEKIHKLDQLEIDLRKTAGVGTVRSLPDFFHSLEHLEHPFFPNSRRSIAETYFIYSMAEKNPVEAFLADQDHSARIEMRLHDLPSDEMQQLVKDLKATVQARFPEDQVSVGGMGAIVHIINDELSTELIFGFWQALGIIAVLLAFIFRSLRWSLVACIPNLVPPIALLGYLSLTRTPIKPGVAIIFSIALGLAFNNTVYVLNRLRTLRKQNRDLPVAKAFYLEGNPCLVSTFIMMAGFSVFLFSYFSLNQTFGACMLVSIVGGLIGDLVFLPVLLKTFPFALGPLRKPARAPLD